MIRTAAWWRELRQLRLDGVREVWAGRRGGRAGPVGAAASGLARGLWIACGGRSATGFWLCLPASRVDATPAAMTYTPAWGRGARLLAPFARRAQGPGALLFSAAEEIGHRALDCWPMAHGGGASPVRPALCLPAWRWAASGLRSGSLTAEAGELEVECWAKAAIGRQTPQSIDAIWIARGGERLQESDFSRRLDASSRW